MAAVAAETIHSEHAVRTPANLVTMLRIVLAPIVVFVIFEYAPAWWVLVFGFLSMITDKIDGVLARRYGTSKLGILLDPIADKVMVLGSLIAISVQGWAWWLPVAIIVVRELAMSWFRSHYARQNIYVTARPLAKIKTWVQSFSVAFVLIPGVVENAKWFPTTVLWVAVFLTVFTFLQYVLDARKSFVTTKTV